jgi:MFS family permease
MRDLMSSATLETTASVWRFKPYLRLWWARVAAAAGVQMLAVAIGWHMYEVTHNVYDLGMVGLMQFLPRVALIFVVGTTVDRYDRRKILGASLALQGLVALILAFGSSPYGFEVGRFHIYALALAIGVAQAFTMPAMQSLVPNVVPASLLSQAISAGASALQGATIIAPAIGGLIYGIGWHRIGPPLSYGFTAACFFIGTALVWGVALLAGGRVSKEPVTLDSVFAGLRFMKTRPDILGAVSLDLFAVLLGGATALLPAYAETVLHLESFGVGLLRAAPAVGALFMSFWLTKFPIHRKVGKRMFGAVAVFGLATIVFGLSQEIAAGAAHLLGLSAGVAHVGAFTVSMLSLIVLGASDMVSVVIRSSFVQLETPDAMRGRVSAVNSLFIGASNELGEFESGMVAGLMGLVPGIVFGGVGTIVVVLLGLKVFPSLAKRDHMVTPEEAKAME